MTKKIALLIFLGLIAFLNFSLRGHAQALASDVKPDVKLAAINAQITTVDLGVINPGILPSNPFYFLKDWRRSASLVFTSEPLSKSQLELNYLNERAAEIEKMVAINDDDVNIIKEALEDYSLNLTQLGGAVSSIKSDVAGQNTSDFLTQFVNSSIKYIELFDDIKLQFAGDDDLKDKLDDTGANTAKVAMNAVKQFDTPNDFLSRLANIKKMETENKDNLRALFVKARLVGALSSFEEKSSSDFARTISDFRDNLLVEIKNELSGLGDDLKKELSDPEFVKQLPGDEMEIFNDITASSTEVVSSTASGINEQGVCNEIYAPVCGSDQKTYPNECFAGLAKVKVDYEGECKEDEGRPQPF